MEEYILENKLKLIYKNTDSELSSICISLNAGAGVEDEKLGVAHATEHMVYKGTRNRTEKEINEELSNLFGFNNAMTNYPYVIYYGTLLKEDLDKGVELLSDIIINPILNETGFKEEMDVIKEELKEWDEELEQYCEDKLFFNSFEERRIKYPIIGTKESLELITLNDIKDFYNKYYFPENTSITIISSLEFSTVIDVLNKYFGKWDNDYCKDYKKDYKSLDKLDLNSYVENRTSNYEENKTFDNELINTNINYEELKQIIFRNTKGSINTCKVQIICQIDKLNKREMKALRIFNQYFGEGVNSILYDTLRTKNGLIYDVITKIAHESYIKLYKITFSTSKENVEKALNLINQCIYKLEISKTYLTDNVINQLIKSYKLKRLFREEQSIVLAKELATYETMFGDYKIYENEIDSLDILTKEDIINVGINVLKKLTVQIID